MSRISVASIAAAVLALSRGMASPEDKELLSRFPRRAKYHRRTDRFVGKTYTLGRRAPVVYDVETRQRRRYAAFHAAFARRA